MSDTLYALPQFTPARAKSVSDKKLAEIWDDPEWIAEEKLDGWRYCMLLGGGLPRVYLTGRRISSKTGLLSEKGLQVPCLWPNPSSRAKISLQEQDTLTYLTAKGELGLTVLDGEIMPPAGAGFRDIAGIMSADPVEAAATMERIGNPTYRVFDMLYDDGADIRSLSMYERKKCALEFVYELRHPLISVVDSMLPRQDYYNKIVADGGEGVILKNICAPYGESGAWVKVKKFSTLDVVVTDFTRAKFGVTGKYDGQIGAAVVSVYLQGQLCPVGRVSGMDDATRLDMTENPGRWLGVVIEVRAQEFGKERLRHPRYERRRDDADARTCTYEKMMRDLGRDEELEDDQTPTPGQLKLL